MRVGVIGGGAWTRVHLAALSASPHVQGITLVARNAAAGARLASDFSRVQATTDDVRVVLDDAGIEVVSIVLPHDCHAAQTQTALAAGKHVICEKPAALNVAELDASLAAATQHNRRFLVVMNQLYNPLYQRVRQLIDAGEVGRPFLSVENAFADRRASYRQPGDWRTTVARSGGGMLIDGGFHMVYRHLHSLAGAGWPAWVQAHTPQLALDDQTEPDPKYGEDLVAITVGYSHRLRIQWAHGWSVRGSLARSRQSFLAGTQATLELTDDPKCPLVLLKSSSSPRSIEVPGGPTTGQETTRTCLLDYVDCLATGRAEVSGGTELARWALAVIEASYRSSRLQKRVALESLRS